MTFYFFELLLHTFSRTLVLFEHGVAIPAGRLRPQKFSTVHLANLLVLCKLSQTNPFSTVTILVFKSEIIIEIMTSFFICHDDLP